MQGLKEYLLKTSSFKKKYLIPIELCEDFEFLEDIRFESEGSYKDVCKEFNDKFNQYLITNYSDDTSLFLTN